MLDKNRILVSGILCVIKILERPFSPRGEEYLEVEAYFP